METYSGTSNLQANWSANEIDLFWYDGDELLYDIPEESWSCVYDGTLTPPPAPTKTGYTFKGWRVRCMLENLGDKDISINGTDYGYTRLNGGAGYNESTYGLTVQDNRAQWAVTFSYGVVKGTAFCATQGYSNFQYYSEQQICWCETRQYISSDDDKVCYLKRPNQWVYENSGSYSNCADTCAQHCAEGVKNSENVRNSAYYGVSW